MLQSRSRKRPREEAHEDDGDIAPAVKLSQTFAESFQDQAQSPLFSIVPGEIRNRIFALALLEYENKAKPFPLDSYVVRPGFRYVGRIDNSLVATCRLVYLETHLLPVSSNEHVFWHNRGLKTKKEHDYFKRFTDEQCDAVERVRFFMQMFVLEDHFKEYCKTPRMTPKILNVTIRHTDWWHWEENHPLKLKEDWFRHLKFIESLEQFELELETMERDKDQLAAIANRVKGVRIPVSNNRTLTAAKNALKWSKWNGPIAFQNQLQYDSGIGQWVWLGPGSRCGEEDVADKMAYHIVKLTWTVE